jgi:acetyl-CoA acyltransferase
MAEVVIVDAVRTPLGRRAGSLSGVRPDELMALTLRRLVSRMDLDPGLIGDVQVGCVNAVGEQGRNIGRMAVLAAGFPPSVAGMTVNRMCGSSQQAVHSAAHAIMAGQLDLAIAGGVESMSRVPLGADTAGVAPSAAIAAHYDLVGQGESAELIADQWRLTREELDAFAVQSHRRAAAAWDEGRFAAETFPVPSDVTGALMHKDPGSPALATDEGIRRDTSVERLAGLKPAFRPDGRLHAGNSSQITDGAAAVLLADADRAKALGLPALARIVATDLVGVDPVMMLHGVIPVTAKILARTGLSVADIDLFEVNEAFASVVLAWLRESKADPDRVNVNGGAIALGHPTGCSGVRLLTTLTHELHRRQGRFGLQVMCIGYGMATATLVERLG